MSFRNLFKNAYSWSKVNGSILKDSIQTKPTYAVSATEFVNKSDLSSSTNYLIWVDTENFKTNIYKGSKNNWELINSYLCSVGKDWNPTIKGTFIAGPKGYSFGEARGYRCLYYTQIKGNYLFHSIPYNLDGTIRDNRLGIRITDGCVRLATPHAKWIYDNFPTGSTVYIT